MTVSARPIRTPATYRFPDFALRVAGKTVARGVADDLVHATVHDRIDDLAMVELVFNDTFEDKRWRYADGDLFRPGQDLELDLGYVDDLSLVFRGEIVALEPDFSNGEIDTLTVRGFDRLHRMRGQQHTWSWTDIRDSDLALELGKKPISSSRPGLDIAVTIDEPARATETPADFVCMHNQHAIVFLLERARRHGYVIELRDDGETLYFGPSESEPSTPQALVWGDTLLDFTPALNLARQVGSVVVRGWNRRTKAPIEATARWADLDLNADLRDFVSDALSGRREVVTELPLQTPGEAKALARDLLRRQLKRMVEATGVAMGLPTLRAGQAIHVLGVGERFGGRYFVAEATHRYDDDGYFVDLTVWREGAA